MHLWAEHYKDLFGDKHLVQKDALASIPQQIVKLEPPTIHEQRKLRKPSPSSSMAKQLALMVYQLKCLWQKEMLPLDNYLVCSHSVGKRELSCKTLRCIDSLCVKKQRREIWLLQLQRNLGLYAIFIDLTKALMKDTVSQGMLWNILMKLGCLPKFLAVIHHKWCQARLRPSTNAFCHLLQHKVASS